MRPRVRDAVRALGLIFFGTALALVALEFGLRALGGGGPAELDADYDRPVTGYAPGVDPEPQSGSGPEGGLRVAVVGDSFTVGFANQWYDAYPRRLEHLLNLNPGAPAAEVEAFARSDTTTWEQLRFLDRVMAWEPDVLILGVFLNDTEDPRDPELARHQEALALRVPTGWRLRLLRASRLAAWAHLRWEQARSYRAAIALQDHVFAADYSGLDRFRKAVRTFARTCRKNDIALVAVVWPSMGALGPAYPHQVAHATIGEVLQEARVPTLDLLDQFVDKSSTRLAVYPGVDNHPNEIGHRIGATAIFQFLLRKRVIDPAYRPLAGPRMSPNYWLRRVQKRRSPIYVEPPTRGGGSGETGDEAADGG